MRDLKEIKENARSHRPEESKGKLIHVEVTKKEVFYYFVDTEGNYWYQTEGTMKFEAEMEMRRKERKGMLRKQNGLSAGMSVVERFMKNDLDSRTLDHNYGQAYAELREMFIKGRITENELGAALVTLDNQHQKIRSKALLRESMCPIT